MAARQSAALRCSSLADRASSSARPAAASPCARSGGGTRTGGGALSGSAGGGGSPPLNRFAHADMEEMDSSPAQDGVNRAGGVPAARSIHTWNRRAVRTRACSDEPTRGGRGLAYKRAMTGRRVRYEYGGGTGAGRSRHRPTYRSAEYTRGRTRREAVTPCEQRERLPSFGGGGGHPHPRERGRSRRTRLMSASEYYEYLLSVGAVPAALL